ncbi:MAG TPA: helix-turn-helix domain-containing protein, partial [Vicinamibacterales bacterium]|nr:helix-turn-helix domain-containing protein [Vicinamibacterales bacterium]
MLAAAAGGTLVVDDVSEMPRGMRIHLAEALEARGQGSAHGDFAVVALTAHDLRARVADERFSGELFDRLCRLELTIPPLRERRDDIPYLTAAFVRRVAARLGKPVDAVTPAAERVLSTARWEGNVRELSQVVERACILANSRLITERELSGPAASAALNDTKPTEIFSQGLPLARRDTAPLGYIEREHIVDTLRRVGGNRMAAAKVLGISRRALYRRLERHHILLPSSQGGRQRHLS